MTPRRARLVLVLVVLGVVGVGVAAWEPVWRWASTHREYTDTYGIRGWRVVEQWDRNKQLGRVFFWPNGFKMQELELRDSGERRYTQWRPDGTVERQAISYQGTMPNNKEAPPWLWGVTDQTEPTMPAWMKDDEKWQAALDAQE